MATSADVNTLVIWISSGHGLVAVFERPNSGVMYQSLAILSLFLRHTMPYLQEPQTDDCNL